ncbi:cell division protein FtsQ/DivIB [Wenxinia saemankumensis]|uniref:Cell division protein FtsQ n=1 Tax=Wenxinia saemankumensis TaxID=1447782 RepID=A0A1M6CHX8_9RHOB|nr:cell division protein FtsQ/DivIB [Wenxinia saemankumensis]SHI60586.1 cell division protein FtsQ [Wenxinia saemankumensis]
MRSLISLVRRPAEKPGRVDPAPSRWGYRFHRLMLTPSFRGFLRVGLPVIVIGGLVIGWAAQRENRDAAREVVAGLRQQIETRPEFMVTGVDVSGADLALAAAIGQVLSAHEIAFPVSSFALDLEEIRAAVTDLTAVRETVVRVRPGGVLEIAVDQRRPVAVWRHLDGLRLLDADGVMTGMIAARTDRPDLPLLAGDGVRAHTEEALALFEAARPLEDRVRGLVRMGQRRWDLLLDRDQRVLLPEQQPVAALERLLALDETQDVLDRDVSVIDLRNAQRIIVRVSPMGMDTLRLASGDGR